jgi:hypothetical protein
MNPTPVGGSRRNPFRVGLSITLPPWVAPPSQPRALWQNPFGIRTVEDGSRPQRGNAAKPEVVVSSSAFSATSRESRPQNVLR